MDSAPDVPAAEALSDFAHAQCQARWGTLRSEIERAATDPTEEAIHDVRVAIRRYSTALKLFAFAFNDKARRKVHRELRDLRRLAGEVRDRDIAVSLARGEGFRKSHPIVKAWRKERETAAEDLIAALRRVQSSERAEHWRERLSRPGAPASPDDWEPAEPAAGNAARALPATVRQMFAFGCAAVETDCQPEVLHELRLHAKALRYSLELFRPVYGPGIENRISALRELQDALGDFNDAVVATHRVRKTVKRGTKGRKQLRGAFERLAHERSEEAIQHWQNIFNADGQQQWWINYLKRPLAATPAKTVARAPAAREGFAQTAQASKVI